MDVGRQPVAGENPSGAWVAPAVTARSRGGLDAPKVLVCVSAAKVLGCLALVVTCGSFFRAGPSPTIVYFAHITISGEPRV